MKKLMLFTVFSIGMLTIAAQNAKGNTKAEKVAQTEHPIVGKWVRIGHAGPICFDFKENGIIECDFGNDQTVDVISNYELSGDTIKFIDKEGQMCQGQGLYKVYITDYYVSFDLIDDNCGGRIKSTMGFWTKPNFNDLLTNLDAEISNAPKPELYLNRARIYMATGKPKQAKVDFDAYILIDTANASVYLNRAGTRFPDDLKGVVLECNKAIALEPDNKNAYFLRGLAQYELNEKEQACQDFSKAIDLGFSVLKIAEQEKCAEFWNK